MREGVSEAKSHLESAREGEPSPRERSEEQKSKTLRTSDGLSYLWDRETWIKYKEFSRSDRDQLELKFVPDARCELEDTCQFL